MGLGRFILCVSGDLGELFYVYQGTWESCFMFLVGFGIFILCFSWDLEDLVYVYQETLEIYFIFLMGLTEIYFVSHGLGRFIIFAILYSSTNLFVIRINLNSGTSSRISRMTTQHNVYLSTWGMAGLLAKIAENFAFFLIKSESSVKFCFLLMPFPSSFAGVCLLVSLVICLAAGFEVVAWAFSCFFFFNWSKTSFSMKHHETTWRFTTKRQLWA